MAHQPGFEPRPVTDEDVGVDHRRPDVAMAQKVLDRSDVVTAFEQVGGEGMPEVWPVAPFVRPAFAALLAGLYQGKNRGKMLVRLA